MLAGGVSIDVNRLPRKPDNRYPHFAKLLHTMLGNCDAAVRAADGGYARISVVCKGAMCIRILRVCCVFLCYVSTQFSR